MCGGLPGWLVGWLVGWGDALIPPRLRGKYTHYGIQAAGFGVKKTRPSRKVFKYYFGRQLVNAFGRGIFKQKVSKAGIHWYCVVVGE